VASGVTYSFDVEAMTKSGSGDTFAIKSALLNVGSWGSVFVISAPISVQCQARILYSGVPIATRPSKLSYSYVNESRGQVNVSSMLVSKQSLG
jgi:hypothetical protein